MKKIILLIALFAINFAQSQEVLNGNMEIRADPAPVFEYVGQISQCAHWDNATYSCDWMSTEIGTDSPFAGWDPHSGTGNARFAGTSGAGHEVYKEIILGEIIDLVAGETYNLSFWVKRLDGNTNMEVGAYISSVIPDLPETPAETYTQTLFPQVKAVVPGGNDSYMKISGCFVAPSTGLHYVAIGVFKVYPEDIEEDETNIFIADDVSIELASGSLPIGNIVLEEEFCSADDIIADASSAVNFSEYQWLVSTASGTLIYATDVIGGAVSTFNIKTALAMAGTPLVAGNCYQLKLILHGSCNVEVIKNFCIASTSIHLSTTDDPPFCEGETIDITTDGEPDWNYTWSTGETGVGLSSISPTANLVVDNYSVTATTPSGCTVSGSLPVVVHPAENIAPTLLNEVFTFYTGPGEELCFGIYSTDTPNEEVKLTYSGKPAGSSIIVNESHQQYANFCWTPTGYNYGTNSFTISLTDNNACGALSQNFTFNIVVTCALCPTCVYYENRTPELDPLPEITEAAKCIEAGLSEPVVTGDDPVEFRAGEYIELGDFFTEGPFFAQITGETCIEECTNCCDSWDGFTYDYMLDSFAPDGDGLAEYWFLNDYSNSYCAFNATGFEIWVGSSWKRSDSFYYRSHLDTYCCPFLAANNETGLNHTDINWDGSRDDGDFCNYATYNVTVLLYACNGETLEINHKVTKMNDELLMPMDDSTYSTQSFITPTLEEIKDEPIFFIYPSPTSDILNVTIGRMPNENTKIYVYDINSRICLSSAIESTSNQLDVSFLAPGIYTILLVDEDITKQLKFVKI